MTTQPQEAATMTKNTRKSAKLSEHTHRLVTGKLLEFNTRRNNHDLTCSAGEHVGQMDFEELIDLAIRDGLKVVLDPAFAAPVE